jgi:hypothetical protein
MNKIVREHYPVSKLPEDLRQEFAGLETVRVVIEEESKPAEKSMGALIDERYAEIISQIKPMTFQELMADRLANPAKYRGNVTPEEAVARIRALRDEWDE